MKWHPATKKPQMAKTRHGIIENVKQIVVWVADAGYEGAVMGRAIQYYDGDWHLSAQGYNGNWNITHWAEVEPPKKALKRA